MNIAAKIEAILFHTGEPVSEDDLALYCSVSKEEVRAALPQLEQELVGRGVRLLRNAGSATLKTTPEVSELIARMQKEELSRDLGKAGAETLAIILYRGPVSRSDVDAIRGVNSTFIIRNLLIRGLIEKVANPKDQRSFLYMPTFELLAHLGIEKVQDLPEFDIVERELNTFEADKSHDE